MVLSALLVDHGPLEFTSEFIPWMLGFGKGACLINGSCGVYIVTKRFFYLTIIFRFQPIIARVPLNCLFFWFGT